MLMTALKSVILRARLKNLTVQSIQLYYTYHV